MTKHTPRPWLVEGRTVYALNDDGYNRFSALVQDAHTPGDELEANARLMAAAPELLKACEEALDDLVDEDGVYFSGDESLVKQLRAAIAKALGEA